MADIALCAAIGINVPGGGAPEWLHLLPRGEARTADGRGPYRITDAAAVMAASLRGGKLVLDENHATDLAAPKGLPSPARGWIVELQHRANGIWGRVEWTEQGRQLAEARAYRGVSPAIVHRQDGTVTAIARASLTNLPNLSGLTSLHSKDNAMDFRIMITDLLGLPAEADDEQINNKIKLLLGHKDVKALQSSHGEAKELALQANLYLSKLARDGITISLPAAVHAVRNGTAT
jgi:phage I-like protein